MTEIDSSNCIDFQHPHVVTVVVSTQVGSLKIGCQIAKSNPIDTKHLSDRQPNLIKSKMAVKHARERETNHCYKSHKLKRLSRPMLAAIFMKLAFIAMIILPIECDILPRDAVIVGFSRAQALLPVDAVGLGGLRVKERDEDIMTGFHWGRHNDSRQENLEWMEMDVGGNSVGNSRRFELFKYRSKNRLRFFQR